MNNNFQKGKLKRWNDDKGFGFIASGNEGRDIFIHISALKRMSRRPAVGDVIIYQVRTDNDGKKRAVNAKIEGVAEVKPRPVRKNSKKQNKSKWFSNVLSIVFVILVGSIAYDKFVARNKLHEKPTSSIPSYAEKEENRQNYRCEGKVYCSEMTSCDEAEFYQRNCPGTKMDGDNDGIPCERQCGW